MGGAAGFGAGFFKRGLVWALLATDIVSRTTTNRNTFIDRLSFIGVPPPKENLAELDFGGGKLMAGKP
jgi:hypothetical protein